MKANGLSPKSIRGIIRELVVKGIILIDTGETVSRAKLVKKTNNGKTLFILEAKD